MITFKDFLGEGKMKRSDPYISGELDSPAAAPKPPSESKISPNEMRLVNLSQRSGVPLLQVKKIWDETVGEVDSSAPNRWAIITGRVKKKLNLSD